jgi:RES domain-containing protein
VYLSETVALALLEILVHVDGSLLPNYVTIPVTFQESMVSTVDRATLPDDWRSYPGPFKLRRIGDDWAASRASCLLKVPSVVVPDESNYLLNPEHPDFQSMVIGDAVDLKIDLRLLNE